MKKAIIVTSILLMTTLLASCSDNDDKKVNVTDVKVETNSGVVSPEVVTPTNTVETEVKVSSGSVDVNSVFGKDTGVDNSFGLVESASGLINVENTEVKNLENEINSLTTETSQVSTGSIELR